jgi:hypothetical protein
VWFLYLVSTAGIASLLLLASFISWEAFVRLVWMARARAASRRLRSSLLCSSPVLSLVQHEREVLYAKARLRTLDSRIANSKGRNCMELSPLPVSTL